jgi:hypothetical protein
VRQQAEADALQAHAEAEKHAYAERAQAAAVLQEHPVLLRLAELETLRELARNANARLYLDFGQSGLGPDDNDREQAAP